MDIPTRPGVTQRFLLLTPPEAKAAVILFAGGHGGLDIQDDGRFGWGGGNFLVRSRDLFAQQGLVVAVIDKPSDLAGLSGQRQTAQHVADVRAVMRWLRAQYQLPVWLVGTSRGTQSAAYVATALAGDADSPDGLVLTSTILTDSKDRPVPAMALDRLALPVLVVHHEKDGCEHCRPSELAALMDKLPGTLRKDLVMFSGGVTRGDPCGAYAYHGFNGIEQDVVGRIGAWIVSR
ncbi:alpha/beta hydrolase [Thiobacter aerophilum]|uniref:Alpha/beta hydrolase n=1 Tax=Thiobacter aerophilum TaxID=3121275 RepID=A0ABV0EF24_9BURK